MTAYILSVLVSILTGNEGQLASALPRLTEELIPPIANTGGWARESRQQLSDDLASLIEAPGSHSIDFEAVSTVQILDFLSSLHLLSRTAQIVLPARTRGAASLGRGTGASAAGESLKLGEELRRVLADAADRSSTKAPHLTRAIALSKAIRQCNVVAFRQQLVHTGQPQWTHWHLTLIRKVVGPLERESWAQLKASYVSVTLPSYALGRSGTTAPAWLERMLLLDSELQGLPAETSHDLARAQRLARALERQGLPPVAAAAGAQSQIQNREASALSPWAGAISAVSMPAAAPALAEAVVGGKALTLRVR